MARREKARGLCARNSGEPAPGKFTMKGMRTSGINSETSASPVSEREERVK